jgi:hypothetical protein
MTTAQREAVERARERPSDPDALAALELSSIHQKMLEIAEAESIGTASWRFRKTSEAHDVLALAQVAPPGRMSVLTLDMRGELRVTVNLAVPVPMTPHDDGSVRVAFGAVVMLRWPEELATQPVSGSSLGRVLQPWCGVHHPNIAAVPGQPLCLGVQVPTGLPLTELVLATYGLLSLQNVMMDVGDAAGVMSAAAARYWQNHKSEIPLTNDPFFGPVRTEAG